MPRGQEDLDHEGSGLPDHQLSGRASLPGRAQATAPQRRVETTGCPTKERGGISTTCSWAELERRSTCPGHGRPSRTDTETDRDERWQIRAGASGGTISRTWYGTRVRSLIRVWREVCTQRFFLCLLLAYYSLLAGSSKTGSANHNKKELLLRGNRRARAWLRGMLSLRVPPDSISEKEPSLLTLFTFSYTTEIAGSSFGDNSFTNLSLLACNGSINRRSLPEWRKSL